MGGGDVAHHPDELGEFRRGVRVKVGPQRRGLAPDIPNEVREDAWHRILEEQGFNPGDVLKHDCRSYMLEKLNSITNLIATGSENCR